MMIAMGPFVGLALTSQSWAFSPDNRIIVKGGQLHTTSHGKGEQKLSATCQAAVTLDSNLPNEYCRGNCVGWEQRRISSDEFHTHCLVDQTLLEFATGQKAKDEACFSEWTPYYAHVLNHLRVAYPGQCQSSCQNHEKCSWFSVLKNDGADSKGTYECVLVDSEAISVPLATVASGNIEACDRKSFYPGVSADCAFGSNLCLTETINAIKPLDAAIIGIEGTVHGISGPKYCRGSSNNVADSICTITQDIMTKYYNNYRASAGTKFENFKKAIENFHGIDHLFGARTIFPLNRWNAIIQGPKRKSPSTDVPFIDDILAKKNNEDTPTSQEPDVEESPTIMR